MLEQQEIISVKLEAVLTNRNTGYSASLLEQKIIPGVR